MTFIKYAKEMISNVNLDDGPFFVIFLLSGWLTAHKVLTKSRKIVLASKFAFEVITTKLSH